MKIKSLTLNSNEQVITKIIGEVLRAFRVEIVEGDADFDELQIINHIDGDRVITWVVTKNFDGEKVFKSSDFIRKTEKRSGEIHRIIKKNLYRVLTENLKLHGVPYGIMHGVRPTKIIHRWLHDKFAVTSQGVIDCDKISRRLRADYLTSYEKSLLLTEVAVRQIPVLSSGDDKTVAVYVGIPFCVTRCLYCSFPSNILPNENKIAEFMEVLTRDIDAAVDEIKRYGFKVQSIYIGGGTPTSLPINFFTEMLEKVHGAFNNGYVEEFTVECGRADTIDDEKISAMKNFGVNRVCVNPQTMQQKTLDIIGRKHTPAQVVTAYEKLRQASDWLINMDLILGLPEENFDDVIDSLIKILALNPDDITLHALALKRGSKLQTQLADDNLRLNDLKLPPDDEVRKMAAVAEKILRSEKYLPYYLYRQGYISGQIENIGYCKDGAASIYNVQIMGERQTILGVGAAASTKVPDNKAMRLQTSFNAKDLTTYLRDIDKYIGNRSKILAAVYGEEI